VALLVGLTGGIGSGKTLAASYFEELGAHVIDADRLARALVAPGMPALAEIVDAFGEEVLLADGALDRKKMAAIVFSDPAKKKQLEGILHPRVIARELEVYRAILSQDPRAVVVVDAAVLLESGNHRNMDKVIVVDADPEAQIERAARRGGLSRADIEKRMAAQWSLEKKRQHADFVLDNRQGKEQLQSNVAGLYKKLKALAESF